MKSIMGQDLEPGQSMKDAILQRFKDNVRVSYDDQGKSLREGPLTVGGFDDALIGTCTQFSRSLAVYDRDRMIQIMMDRDGATYEEAEEHFPFNIEGAWMGPYTPIFLSMSELQDREAELNEQERKQI